jgi:uncharacterized protein YegP (UPF0339 family)
MSNPHFEIVDDKRGGFHARYISGNQIIWWTENYTRKEAAQRAIALLKMGAAKAPAEDKTRLGRIRLRRAG